MADLMTHPYLQPTRRNLIKMIAGVPLLPLGGALASAGVLSGCGGDADDPASSAKLSSVNFLAMAAPSLAGAAAMATTTVGSTLVASFDDAGDWESPLHDKIKATLDPLIRANYADRFSAAVGYATATGTQVKLKA
jgi:ABC-type uncharacterized transport system YnjBCD permease subunit